MFNAVGRFLKGQFPWLSISLRKNWTTLRKQGGLHNQAVSSCLPPFLSHCRLGSCSKHALGSFLAVAIAAGAEGPIEAENFSVILSFNYEFWKMWWWFAVHRCCVEQLWWLGSMAGCEAISPFSSWRSSPSAFSSSALEQLRLCLLFLPEDGWRLSGRACVPSACPFWSL